MFLTCSLVFFLLAIQFLSPFRAMAMSYISLATCNLLQTITYNDISFISLFGTFLVIYSAVAIRILHSRNQKYKSISQNAYERKSYGDTYRSFNSSSLQRNDFPTLETELNLFRTRFNFTDSMLETVAENLSRNGS